MLMGIIYSQDDHYFINDLEIEGNNSISKNIVNTVVKKANTKKINLKKSKILILGITFKENCSDSRNSRVIDLFKEFRNE